MRRPLPDLASMLAASDEVWRALSKADWMEAFHSHPRIGESGGPQPPGSRSTAWSAQEQAGVQRAQHAVKMALAEANRKYERHFHHPFIVCATGKSGSEILAIVERRLHHERETELHEAVEQQRQITHVRLKKWLQE
jgi:2-oxo-4-hydroxy-4-carboxy-5-ureidoimidazoline decarboxylase